MLLNQQPNNFENIAHPLSKDLKSRSCLRSKRSLAKDTICGISGVGLGLTEVFLPFGFERFVKKFTLGITQPLLAITKERGSCGGNSMEELQKTQRREINELKNLLLGQTENPERIERKIDEISEQITLGFKHIEYKVGESEGKLSALIHSYLSHDGDQRLVGNFQFSIKVYGREIGSYLEGEKRIGKRNNDFYFSLEGNFEKRIERLEKFHGDLIRFIELIMGKDLEIKSDGEILNFLFLGALAYINEFVFLRAGYIFLTNFYYKKYNLEKGSQYFNAFLNFEEKISTFKLIDELNTLFKRVQRDNSVKLNSGDGVIKALLRESIRIIDIIKNNISEKKLLFLMRFHIT